MSNIMDTLITDRTQADVDRAKYLNSLWDARARRWMGTLAEWEEWKAGPRGAYGFNDMNRVTQAVAYLTGLLTEMGYHVETGEVVPAYNIVVGVIPSIGGIASGSGVYYQDDEATVTAQPSEKYDFVGWMEAGELVSEDLQYTFTVDRSRNLTAAFSLKKFQVSVSVDPQGSGETSGAGVYDIDSEVTVAATAGDGYIFSNWTEVGQIVSDSPEYTFVLDSDRSLLAVMAKVWVITLSANDDDFGTYTGAGTYLDGQQVTLSAVPADGYGFSGWSENGSIVSTDETYSFTATGDRNIQAVFAKEVVITLDVYPESGGTVLGGGTYLEGEQVTINAVSETGYRFVNWMENFTPPPIEIEHTVTIIFDDSLGQENNMLNSIGQLFANDVQITSESQNFVTTSESVFVIYTLNKSISKRRNVFVNGESIGFILNLGDSVSYSIPISGDITINVELVYSP